MSKFNIGACNQCGHRYPTGSTQCRLCREGTYIEIDDPTLDDILAVAKYNENVINSQPMQEGKQSVSPPQINTWQGKELSQLTKEELIEACETLASENRQLRGRAQQDDMTALTRPPAPVSRPFQVFSINITEETRDITEFLNTLFLRHPTLAQLISVCPYVSERYVRGHYLITISHRHVPLTPEQIREALKP